MEENHKMTPANYFKSNKIVHFAIVVGVGFMIIISLFMHYVKGGGMAPELNNILLIVVSILAVIGIIGSFVVFQRKLNKAGIQRSLKERMDSYRGALLLKYAFLEGPSFLAAVMFILFGNYIYLGIAAVPLALLIASAPTRKKLINDLKLTREEAAQIMNPETEIV